MINSVYFRERNFIQELRTDILLKLLVRARPERDNTQIRLHTKQTLNPVMDYGHLDVVYASLSINNTLAANHDNNRRLFFIFS